MMTTMLPLMVDAPACDLPAPGDSMNEPLVVQLTSTDGHTYVLPLSLAAAQALVQLLAGSEAEDVSDTERGPALRAARPARV
jgi:hypothetical protein